MKSSAQAYAKRVLFKLNWHKTGILILRSSKYYFLPLKSRSWLFLVLDNSITMFAVIIITVVMLLISSFWFNKHDIPLQSEICKRNSKSFYFASRSFPDKIRNQVHVFYAFARAADDLIDEARDVETQEKNLILLQQVTDIIGQKTQKDSLMELVCENHESLRPIKKPKGIEHLAASLDPLDINNFSNIILDFAALTVEKDVPKWVIQLLIDGLKQDTIKDNMKNTDVLLKYCLGVASSIGIYCCFIFDCTDQDTLLSASSLGIAMQLTNICRDMLTDLDLGRTYVPNTWFQERGLTRMGFVHMSASMRQRHLQYFALKLYTVAEQYYSVGWKGILQLPKYAQIPIAAALLVYRDIGSQIVYQINKSKVYPKRAYTSKARKLFLYSKAVLLMKFGMEPKFLLQTGCINETSRILGNYLDPTRESK